MYDPCTFPLLSDLEEAVSREDYDYLERYKKALQTHGLTALPLATRIGNLTVVKELVKRGAAIKTEKDSKHHLTAAMIAAKEGHQELLEWIIDQGVDVNDVDDKGKNRVQLFLLELYDINIVCCIVLHPSWVVCFNRYPHDLLKPHC